VKEGVDRTFRRLWKRDPVRLQAVAKKVQEFLWDFDHHDSVYGR
jgi:hypothetical protein